MVSRSAADRPTEFKTLQSVRLRALVEPLVTFVLACPGQAASQKGLLVRGWEGACVDTRAPGGLEVLGRSVFPVRLPVSSESWSLSLLLR